MPLTNVALGQGNFEPGYVITSDGEHIEGEIDDRQWISNPREIRFRVPGEDDIRTYHYRELDEFGVGNDLFRRHTVQLDQTPIGWSREVAEEDRVITHREAMMRVLADGPLTLYQYRQRGEHFFMQTGDGLVELTTHRYYVTARERIETVVVDEFREILAEKTLDCPSVLRSLGAVTLNQRSLARYAYRYNTCIEPDAQPRAVQEGRARIRPGIVAGYGVMGPHRSDIHFNFREVSLKDPVVSAWQVGISTLVDMPGLHSRRSVEVRISYVSSSFSGQYNETAWFCETGNRLRRCPDDFEPGRHTVIIDGSQQTLTDLQFTVQGRFDLARGVARPYLGFGLASAFPLTTEMQGEMTRIHQTDDGDTIRYASQQSFAPARAIVVGPLFTLGYRVGGIQAEINTRLLGRDMNPRHGYAAASFLLGVSL